MFLLLHCRTPLNPSISPSSSPILSKWPWERDSPYFLRGEGVEVERTIIIIILLGDSASGKEMARLLGSFCLHWVNFSNQKSWASCSCLASKTVHSYFQDFLWYKSYACKQVSSSASSIYISHTLKYIQILKYIPSANFNFSVCGGRKKVSSVLIKFCWLALIWDSCATGSITYVCV